MTVRLSELGFSLAHHASAHTDACHLDARQTSIIVRGYRDGDEEAIRDLFQRSFHHELSPELWRWRYLENPLGAQRISVAIASDGRLLGHYGGYPVAFVHGADPPLIAHQNGDVMTDRAARRLAHGGATLVSRLAQHFWAAYGEGHADFHYGFNTGTARALQQRVVPGVRALEEVGVWVADDIRRPPADPHDASLHVERVSRFDDAWDTFATQARTAYGLLARRDAASLNWRYATRPGSTDLLLVVRERARDRIVGGGVFRVQADETWWGDALFDPTRPAAIGLTLTHLRVLGAPSRIRAWFPARPDWWVRMLVDLGFRQEPEPHGLTLVYAPFTSEAERRLPDLYYTWGDSDLF